MVIRPDLKYSNDSVILMVTVKSSLLIWNNAKWTLQLRHETTARTYCVVVTSSGRGGGVGRFWSCHDELYPIIPQGSMIHPHWQLTFYPPPPPKTMWSPQVINNQLFLEGKRRNFFRYKKCWGLGSISQTMTSIFTRTDDHITLLLLRHNQWLTEE